MQPCRFFTAALTILLLFAACSDDVTEPRGKDFYAVESISVDVARGARTGFRLTGINGSIEVIGVPGASSITITGVKRVESYSQADADARLAQLAVSVDSSGSGVVVGTIHPAITDGRNYIVNYTVSVPQDFMVALTNTNGEVRAQSISNDVSIQVVNGGVSGVAIVGNAAMAVTNGGINASVTIPPGGQIGLDVVNGRIDLQIPQATSADFSAFVDNGSITVVGLTLTDVTQTSEMLIGTLGGGDGTISLEVNNGDIRVTGF